MPQETTPNSGYDILIVLLIAVVSILLLAWATKFCLEFSRELRIINNEIGRTEGEQQKRWLRRRRKLWLSLIPFIKY
jgi:hypothetical protein